MKLISIILALLTLASFASGTRWIHVHYPTHTLYIDEGEPGGITEVPCITSSASDHNRVIELLNTPYIPQHANWNVTSDVNLITLYNIKINANTVTRDSKDTYKLNIEIDITHAKQPKGYPHTVEGVLQLIKSCLLLNLGNHPIQVVSP